MNKPQSKLRSCQWPLILLSITLLTVTGCGYAGFVAQVFFPEKSVPVFDLPVVKTAILVDDTHNQLGDPAHTGVIAQQMFFDLIQGGKLTPDLTVDYLFVRNLEAKLGSDFQRTPVDKIGRKLGADQIIHVNIDYVQMSVQPGIIEPKAIVTLKVIDTIKALRLFPAPSEITNIDSLETSKRGYRITVELPRVIMMEMDLGTENILLRNLAEQIGYQASRIFYSHLKNENAQGPGRPSTKGK